MAIHTPVRCPACRREHAFSPPEYPCPCGASVRITLPPDGGAVLVRHRSWSDAWAEVSCNACGQPGQWPRPEFCCPCGAMVRISPEPAGEEGSPDPDRPAFRPVTIRTSYDAVSCAAQFLRWLGFTEVRSTVPRPATGIDVRGPRVVGLVDPTTVPTSERDIETLWLHGLAESVTAVAFSLAGYDRKARVRADELRLPLFVLDLTGTPQPVNDPADALLHRGGTG